MTNDKLKWHVSNTDVYSETSYSVCVSQGRSCRYYHGVQKMREQYLIQQVHNLHDAWDIEDLVTLGKRIRSCAYYAARELMEEAFIIFCPYNYLLDPMIRESVRRVWKRRKQMSSLKIVEFWDKSCPFICRWISTWQARS